MTDCIRHTPQLFTPRSPDGTVIPGAWWECATCGKPLYPETTNASLHPSICKHCGHGITAHDGGCNASVREGLDGVSRCQCLENYGEPS